MNKELTDKLNKRFPFLYRGRYMSLTENLMPFGFEISDGWFDIIWQLSLAIEEELKSQHKFYYLYTKRLSLQDKFITYWNRLIYKISPVNRNEDTDGNCTFLPNLKRFVIFRPEAFLVVQVKEKFGTLRFYTNYSIGKIDDFINLAVGLSSITCEECGEQGQLRGTGWLYTSCKEHAKTPWHYTKEEFSAFKDNTIEFIKWLDSENSSRLKDGEPLLTADKVIKEFKLEDTLDEA